jgi:acetyl-CoA synthetase
MSNQVVYPVAERWSASAWVDKEKYQSMYRQSIEEPDLFWAEQSELFLTWQQPWTDLNNVEFKRAQASRCNQG